MRSKRRIVIGALIMAAGGLAGSMLMGVSFGPYSGEAADHRDFPTGQLPADLAPDITDIYAFRNPSNSNNLVVALNTNPHLPGSPPSKLFSNDVKYQLHVNTNSDLTTDEATVTVTFSGSGSSQKFKVEGLTTTALQGDVTPLGTSTPDILESGGVKVFCGPRDDPFFFDLDAFKTFVSGPYIPAAGYRLTGTPVDKFEGANVASIVLEFPINALAGITSTSGTIKVWASTDKVQTTSGKVTRILSPFTP